MKFADLLPKTSAPEEETGEPVFCSAEEGVRRVAKLRPSGKILIVTDGSALRAFRTFLPSRALCLVLDSEDCLPLFASSDDVSLIVAAGKKSTLTAARFFAALRKIPCAVFPTSAALDGVYEAYGSVLLGGEEDRVFLQEAKVYCDRALFAPSLGQAYMRLLLARLALIEAKALRKFGIDAGREEAEERAYKALLSIKCKTYDPEDVARKNAEIRKCEKDGMLAGEGVCLAKEIGREGEEQAVFLLSALYDAFFLKGKPFLRVPDYQKRAEAAGARYAAQRVPTLQEFARRAAALEGMRAEMHRETQSFFEGETHYRKNFYSLTGRTVAEVWELPALKRLPEKTAGLCSLIRDFALMEWREKDILRKAFENGFNGVIH